MPDIASNIIFLKQQIPESVKLVAVSKTPGTGFSERTGYRNCFQKKITCLMISNGTL
jgi:hypothetical protein